jgi:HAD superfamily hydrolase (TIGR01509 family)
MIKAIIFDFFNVLAVRDSASFRKTFYPNDKQRNDLTLKLQEELGRGIIGYDNFITALSAISGVDKETVLQYTENYQPNSELMDYIRKSLKPKYKIGMISNTGANWVSEILGDAGKKLFDDIVLSYKTGIIKPEAQIYELSAKNLGVMPEECVFIDDILGYCVGAEAVGMNTIWYQNFKQMRGELEKYLSPGPDN